MSIYFQAKNFSREINLGVIMMITAMIILTLGVCSHLPEPQEAKKNDKYDGGVRSKPFRMTPKCTNYSMISHSGSNGNIQFEFGFQF